MLEGLLSLLNFMLAMIALMGVFLIGPVVSLTVVWKWIRQARRLKQRFSLLCAWLAGVFVLAGGLWSNHSACISGFVGLSVLASSILYFVTTYILFVNYVRTADGARVRSTPVTSKSESLHLFAVLIMIFAFGTQVGSKL